MLSINKKFIFVVSSVLILSGTIFGLIPRSVAATITCNQSNLTLRNKCLAQKKQAEEAAAAAAAAAQQAQQLQTQISSINDSITKINASITETESKISDTTDTITKIEAQIKSEEEKLADQKEKMNQLIASWYMQGTSGLLESVMSSNNISDVVDQSQQYDSIKEQINSTIDQIQAYETDLYNQKAEQSSKKTELTDLQAQQKSSKSAAVSQTQQKNSLLGMTLAQQKQYIDAVNAAKQEISNISAQDAEWRRQQDAKSHANISTGGSGGYPYSNPNGLDPWKFYQMQCTSYAAWYWNSNGYNWYNTQPGNGDAKNWDQIANTLGYATGQTPRVGAIISWKNIGSHGHVAIVQKINSDGSIDVSEYNWIAYSYSYRSNVQPGIYGSYVYIYH